MSLNSQDHALRQTSSELEGLLPLIGPEKAKSRLLKQAEQ